MAMMMNAEDETTEYLLEKRIPEILESIMTGLMFVRPDDPIAFMQECLSKIKSDSQPVPWDCFITSGARKKKKKDRKSKAGRPLPPIAFSSDVPDNTELSEATSGSTINKAVVLPPVSSSKSSYAMPDKKVIFVLGGPGVGKGTQCANIVRDFGLCHLSAGDLLREEVASGSSIGQEIDRMIKNGEIVPMETTIRLLHAAMSKNFAATGFLIDGFPRKLDQGLEFETNVVTCQFVLFFECSEATMEARLLKRGETSGRADDNIESIRKRFHTFVNVSMPVIAHYEKLNKVVKLSAEKSPTEVYGDVRLALKKYGFSENTSDSDISMPDAKVYFVLGGPGAGKGTQCANIVRDFGLCHLSAGDLLRDEVASGSELGESINEVIKAGDLVPLFVILKLLTNAMKNNSTASGFLIDGFPRQMDQGAEFERRVVSAKGVVYFDCTEDVMEVRLLKRGETSGRSDDNIESIKKRFRTFLEVSLPVIEHFDAQGKVFKANSNRTPEEVYADVKNYFVSQGYAASEDISMPDAKVYFVLGGPGAGKGTQCANIVRDFGLCHLSAGDLLRDEVASGSELGESINEVIKAGDLVPLFVILKLLTNAMKNNSTASGFLIDGFPRQMDQGAEFERRVVSAKGVVYFDCTEDVMEVRLLKRGETSGRSDDNIESIKKRFRTFLEVSLPVIEHFDAQGKVFKANSNRTPEEVYADVKNYFVSQGYAASEDISMPDAKVYFVLGGPGAGKGTQCANIVRDFGLCHLSAGDLLREEVASGSATGQEINRMIKNGEIVPMQTTIRLLYAAMSQNSSATGFLIDGFPRQMDQGIEFERRVVNAQGVIFFECSEAVMEKRLLKRGETSGRADDNIESIKKRFRTFLDVSLPVIEHFDAQGKVCKVDSEREPDDVYTNVQEYLKNQGFTKQE